MDNLYKQSLYGFYIGDALGVPVEFLSRNELKSKPVTDMFGHGTYNQETGTWSDDTSMTLATMEAMAESQGVDINKMIDCFLKWKDDGAFTPFHEVFDMGIATSTALYNYSLQEEKYTLCGGTDLYSNGNGSLMRILPLVIYLHKKAIDYRDPDYFKTISTVSSITHGHDYSIFGCYIYCVFVDELFSSLDKQKSYQKTKQYFKELFKDEQYKDVKDIYSRIIDQDISTFKEEDIQSSGYVVHSLEASLWCLFNSSSYNEAVLKAVNLGSDTDTIAAITGSMAGILYGIDENWKDRLQNKEMLEDITNRFLAL